MVPAAHILDPNRVIKLMVNAGVVFLFVDHGGPKPHHEPVSRGEDFHHALSPANIEARVIIDLG